MMNVLTLRANALDRKSLAQLSDWLAVGVAVSLPWSTTATGILIVLWLLAVLPTLEFAAVRRELVSAAGGLPVLLLALAIVGMLWADVTWRERFNGLGAYHRLLFIPLLLAQFQRSGQGVRVLSGFFASVSTVLVFSWALALFPGIPWHTGSLGVPVKDYILQGDEFLICAFVLLDIAIDRGRAGRWCPAAVLVASAFLFLANIAFVVTGRTTLLVAPVFALLLGWRHFRWKGLFGAAILYCILGGTTAVESNYLRTRLSTSVVEFQAWRRNDAVNSTALHLQFMKEALSFVGTAPIIGHGTGSIAEQYRNEAVGETGAAAVASVNPHNQILAVAIQLGLVGAAVLLAMWGAHFMLFRGGGLTGWIGFVIVTENVVSSLVNSHLFDFTQGWIYVFGVGVAGGMALRERDLAAAARPEGKL